MMKNRVARVWYTLLLYALLITKFAPVLAQEDRAITLLDGTTGEPIAGISFIYGSQTGQSNDMGIIRFQYQPGQFMQLSGLNYGEILWSEADLEYHFQATVAYLKSSPIDLFPVTIITVRGETRPHQRVSIDQQDRLAHDAASILNQSAAFTSIRKGGNYGFDPVFRGFKYDQLNIVLDGAQSATAACPNRMDPPTSQMAPNMTERIEVLKGPYALRFGTGFGATLNFIPSPVSYSEQTQLSGRLGSSFETNGSVFRNEGRIGVSGKAYDLNFFTSWSQGNDYSDGNSATVQSDFQRGSFGTTLGLRVSENQDLRFSAVYNLARDSDFPALAMDLRKDDTWMFNARHDIRFKNPRLNSISTTVYASFVDHLMDNLLKPLDPRMLNAQTVAKTFNYGGRSEGFWNFGNSRLYAGADLRMEGAEGVRTRSFLMGPNAGKTFEDNAWQDALIGRTAAFGEFRLTLEDYLLTFSGRFELNTARVDDASPEFTAVYEDATVSQFNPSLSFGAVRTLDNNFRLGLWLGRAQRSGGLTERFINYFPVGQDPFEMLGNPQLDPEVNNQADLTFSWKTSKTRLELNLFGSYLEDFISSLIDPNLEPRLPSSPGVRQYININEALKAGFEIGWSQQLGFGLSHNLSAAYTYGKDIQRQEPLPEIAPLDIRYTLAGSYFDGKLSPELNFRHVLEQNRVSAEFGENQTPSFSLLDVQIGYQLTDRVRLSAGVNNVFDTYYFEHLNRSVRGGNEPIYARGRNFNGSISILF